MRFEEIDQTLRSQAEWDPPAGFARRVARLARAQQVEPPVRILDVVGLVPYALLDAARDSAARLAGVRWTLRQYWLLLGS